MRKVGKTFGTSSEIVPVFECEKCHRRSKFNEGGRLDDLEVCEECFRDEVAEAHMEEAVAGCL